MKIAVTGSSGLIGSRFKDLLQEKYDFLELNRRNQVDLTDRDTLFSYLNLHNPSLLIHFAAKTDVDACESDKQDDLNKLYHYSLLKDNRLDYGKINSDIWKNGNSAFAVNTSVTKNIADYANEKNIKVIYISTDFVFSGEDEFYTEESNPNPVDWYGQTKYWGEEIIKGMVDSYIIARLSFPYGYKSDIKKDFVWKIIELLETKDKISLVYDQMVTPTFIDDIVLGLDFLIENKHNNNSSGIYHVTGNGFISPHNMGILIAEMFHLDKNKIGEIKTEEFYKGRAKRPIRSCIKSDKLKQSGFFTKNFEEGLRVIADSS